MGEERALLNGPVGLPLMCGGERDESMLDLLLLEVDRVDDTETSCSLTEMSRFADDLREREAFCLRTAAGEDGRDALVSSPLAQLSSLLSEAEWEEELELPSGSPCRSGDQSGRTVARLRFDAIDSSDLDLEREDLAGLTAVICLTLRLRRVGALVVRRSVM